MRNHNVPRRPNRRPSPVKYRPHNLNLLNRTVTRRRCHNLPAAAVVADFSKVLCPPPLESLEVLCCFRESRV